jgi:hypothetical protein
MLRTLVLGFFMLAAAGGAHAEYIVDTGAGASVIGGSQISDTLRIGGSFSVSQSYHVETVEGWISTINGGHATMWIYRGSPNDDLLVGSVTIDLPPPDTVASWLMFDVPDWLLAPGDYSIAFGTDDPIGAAMPHSAPDPLATTFFWAGGEWTDTADPLSIGIRIGATAVPEPESYALMLLGLAGIGAASRSRAARL